jgi:putative hydrolase of the HAD superfamily
MSSPAEPGVVFWDFDGTLAVRDGMWRGCLIAALDQVHPGHTVTDDMLRARLRDGFPWHRPDEPHTHLSTADLWWAALSPLFVAAYVQAGLECAVAEQAAALVPAVFSAPAYWTVFADTRPALRQLGDVGWRHVIVSNHVPELPRLVADLGLSDLIGDVITSATTGYEKPNPQMFACALRRTGQPRRAWMVGDNPTADIAGAERAGIPGLLVRAEPEKAGLATAVARILDDDREGSVADHWPRPPVRT